jgi:ABC-2 type transport system permease protein
MKPPGPIETIFGRSERGCAGGNVMGGMVDMGRDSLRGAAATRGAAGFSISFTFGLAADFASESLALTGDGRDLRPRRCALPITALRETPPRSSAIWLAVRPFSHIVFRRSIRSSVQLMDAPKNKCGKSCRALRKSLVDCVMTINKSNDATALSQGPEPERIIGAVNWVGLKTLYLKEIRRFMKVQLQTIWGPAITTLLFLVIFTVALGRDGATVMGVPFPDFIAPGLIVMAMVQNAFANSSFALLVGKIQGTIVDYLMPPLSNVELLVAMVGASITRAFFVGGAVWLVMLFWPGVHVSMQHPFIALLFGLLGAGFVSFLGIITSIWAEKFDHNAAITNFVIAPFSLLSGTFYSVDKLAPAFQAISHANPFFYIISGFRYGFLGVTDSNIWLGASVLIVSNIVLGLTTFLLLRSGWKIKA